MSVCTLTREPATPKHLRWCAQISRHLQWIASGRRTTWCCIGQGCGCGHRHTDRKNLRWSRSLCVSFFLISSLIVSLSICVHMCTQEIGFKPKSLKSFVYTNGEDVCMYVCMYVCSHTWGLHEGSDACDIVYILWYVEDNPRGVCSFCDCPSLSDCRVESISTRICIITVSF